MSVFPLIVITGVGGKGFTTTVVTATALVQPDKMVVTEYTPARGVLMIGLLELEVYPPGPLQWALPPPIHEHDKFNAEPTQTGPLFVTLMGAGGTGFTIVLKVAGALLQVLNEITNV